MDIATLRATLTVWQFPWLELQFALVVAFTLASLPQLLRHLAPQARPCLVAGLAAACAVAVVAVVVPRTNRIYYDEHIYQGVAQNLSDLHLAQACNDGTVEYGRLQCWRGEYVKQPYAYPYLLSLGYRLFGADDVFAPRLNTVLAGVFVLGVFVAAGLLFGNWVAAAYSAMAAAVLPEHLLWSGTAAVEPSAAVMVVGSLIAALWYARARTWVALGWLVSTAVFAMQFRMESLLVAPLVAAVLALHGRNVYRSPALWVAAAAAVLLSGVHLLHLDAVRQEAWGATGDRIGLEFVRTNLWPNLSYYVDNSRFPLAVTLLALIGLVQRPRAAVVTTAIAFVLFAGVYLVFYAGSYEYGADVRYALMTHAPLAILAGLGAATVHARLRWLGGAWAHTAIAAVVLVQFVSFLPHVRAVGEEAWAARADVRFAHEIVPRLGSHAIVLTHNPSIFHLRGINAAQLYLASTDAAYVNAALPGRYAGGVYLHWNFWCNSGDPAQAAVCTDAMQRFPSVLVAEYRERDQRFALYKLTPGAAHINPTLPDKLIER